MPTCFVCMKMKSPHSLKVHENQDKGETDAVFIPNFLQQQVCILGLTLIITIMKF